MPLKIIRENQTQLVGRGPVLLAVLPTSTKSRDLYVGKIAEEAALLSKSHAIISEEPKGNQIVDEFPRIASEFEADFEKFLEDNPVDFVLQIAGTNEPGLEVRTVYCGPQTEETLGNIKERFRQDFSVKVSPADVKVPSTNSGKVQTISIALGPEARGFQKAKAIAIISDLVDQINGKLGKSERDKRASDVLD